MNNSSKRLAVIAAACLGVAVLIAVLRIVFPVKVSIDTVGKEFYLDSKEITMPTDVRIDGKVVTYPFVGDIFTGDITVGKLKHENVSFKVGKRFNHIRRYEGSKLVTTGFIAYNAGFENMVFAMYDFDESGNQLTWTSASGRVVTVGNITETILENAFLPY